MFYSSNPGWDAERYIEHMENRPHITCSVCEEPLYEGDQYYEVNDEILCPDCMKDMYGMKVNIIDDE